jgi:hypothetical protein
VRGETWLLYAIAVVECRAAAWLCAVGEHDEGQESVERAASLLEEGRGRRQRWRPIRLAEVDTGNER